MNSDRTIIAAFAAALLGVSLASAQEASPLQHPPGLRPTGNEVVVQETVDSRGSTVDEPNLRRISYDSFERVRGRLH